MYGHKIFFFKSTIKRNIYKIKKNKNKTECEVQEKKNQRR